MKGTIEIAGYAGEIGEYLENKYEDETPVIVVVDENEDTHEIVLEEKICSFLEEQSGKPIDDFKGPIKFNLDGTSYSKVRFAHELEKSVIAPPKLDTGNTKAKVSKTLDEFGVLTYSSIPSYEFDYGGKHVDAIQLNSLKYDEEPVLLTAHTFTTLFGFDRKEKEFTRKCQRTLERFLTEFEHDDSRMPTCVDVKGYRLETPKYSLYLISAGPLIHNISLNS